MKYQEMRFKRKFAAFVAAIMLTEQVASMAPAQYVHAEGKEKAEYSIEQSVTASWDGGYNAEIILTNLSDYNTKDWTLTFCTSDEITNLWGGNITECQEITNDEETNAISEDEALVCEGEVRDISYPYYKYTVEATDHTANIARGGCITVGYSANGNNHRICDGEVELVYADPIQDEDSVPEGGIYTGEGYKIEVVIPDSWDGAYNVKLIISNTSEEVLHNWGLVFETKDTVYGLYNATESIYKMKDFFLKQMII